MTLWTYFHFWQGNTRPTAAGYVRLIERRGMELAPGRLYMLRLAGMRA